MKRNLCLFTDSLEPSGVGEHLLLLASYLSSEYNISFVCPPTQAGHNFLRRAERLGLPTLAIEARDNPVSLDALCVWLREQRIDIFHCHAGIGWECFGGANSARAAGVPAIIRTEHLPYLLTHPIQRLDHQDTVQLVDRIICVSNAVRDSYLEAGVPHSKLTVVRNGIAPKLSPLGKKEAREKLGLPQSASIMLTVGRLTEQKGHSYLLEALPRVIERIPDVYAVWAGGGELESDLRTRARELGLRDRILFLSQRVDVAELLTAADLFVLPSLFEGLPLVVLEAQAVGLPVVGTRVCGTNEAVEDGVTGRVVAPRDPQALCEAIIEVLAKPELAARWGIAGKNRVRREFTVERMARETAAVYEDVFGRALRRHDLSASVTALQVAQGS